MVGQLLEHVGPRFGLALLNVGRHFDLLAILAGPVVERPLESEVDEAGHLLALADRDLAGDQRRDAHRLQSGEQVSDAAVRLVDSVDEHQMRDAELVEGSQGRGGKRSAGRVRVDDEDRHVGERQRPRSVSGEPDRSGAIDDGKRIAEIVEIVEVELGRAAA